MPREFFSPSPPALAIKTPPVWRHGGRRGWLTLDKPDLEEQRALLRADLVAPVLHRDLHRGQQAAILREQAAQQWQMPGGGRRRFSVRTLKRYLQRRRHNPSLDNLRRKTRRDAGIRKRLSDAAWERAQLLKREQPYRSADVILKMLLVQNLIRQGECSPATLRRYLHAAGLTRHNLLQQRPKAYRRWQRKQPGDLWQFDATGGLWLPDPAGGPPHQIWFIAGKDDASRLLVGARAYFHAHQAALDELCKRAFRRWGIPRAVYVDRGSIFVSGHFRRVMAEVGSELIHASAYYAEGKGKIESAMDLLKDGFYPEIQGDIAALRVSTLEQINLALEAWSHYVNHRRHRETKQIPAEVYGPDPRQPFSDPLGLDELFLWRRTAQVDKFGTVALEGNRYTAGSDLRGRKVQLRYDPFDLSRVQLWVEGVRRGDIEPVALLEHVAEPVRADPVPQSQPGATMFSFLAQLRADYEAELRRQAEDIPFRAAPRPLGPQLGQLIRALEDLLGRALRPSEQHLLHTFWQQHGPLPADLASDRLRPHLGRLGRQTPVSEIVTLLWRDA
jgi:putative transposase